MSTVARIGRSESGPEHLVLWDVVEEHLDEAAFHLEQFERALEHPSRTLAELDRYPEGRLRAHLDALVVGGAPVRDRVLLPTLEGADPEEPARVTAAALALLAGGHRDPVASVLSHEHAAVRGAAVRALALAGDDGLPRRAAADLRTARSSATQAALLDLHAARMLPPPPLLDAMRSDDPTLAAAAARAARWGEPRTHLPALEYMLGHDDSAVREAALVSALSLGSARAWATCRRWAFEEEPGVPLAMTACAALGGRAEQARLGQRLARDPRPEWALFALTFCGDPRQVPPLIERLRSAEPLHAKLALQAIAGITGLDVRDDAFALPEHPPVLAPGSHAAREEAETRAALPPIEEDKLDADLVPWPEDALPLPNVTAVERFWSERAGRFDSGRRYLAGRAFGPAALVKQLEVAPLRRRHVLAFTLCACTGAGAWLDTRGWSAQQSAGLRALRARAISFPALGAW